MPDDAHRDQERHTAFMLRLNGLPLTYLSSKLARKILFLGKAARILRLPLDATVRASEPRAATSDPKCWLPNTELTSLRMALEDLKHSDR